MQAPEFASNLDRGARAPACEFAAIERQAMDRSIRRLRSRVPNLENFFFVTNTVVRAL
jgi:hypothetical protein